MQLNVKGPQSQELNGEEKTMLFFLLVELFIGIPNFHTIYQSNYIPIYLMMQFFLKVELFYVHLSFVISIYQQIYKNI